MNAAQGMANVRCLDHLVRRGITDDDGVLGGAVSITQVYLVYRPVSGVLCIWFPTQEEPIH